MSRLPPDRSFGHIIRDINRVFQRELSNRIEKYGISLGQWYALRVLWIQDGLTQAEIAQRSGNAAPNVVSALRTLTARGFVVRDRHPTDQRKNVIFLTKKGRQLETPCLLEAMDINSIALSHASKTDINSCLAMLNQARRNLECKPEAVMRPVDARRSSK